LEVAEMANEVESVRQLTSEIEGCISDAEGELLYRLAKDVPEGQAIVEVGRGKDKSTVWLAKGSEAGEKNKVYSIASHKGSPDHVKVDEENMQTEFIANLTKAGVQDTVVSLHETSEEAVIRWKEKIGLLWINTSHEYEDVKKVILSWQSHLYPNAIMAVHGCNQPGPSQAVKECLGNLGYFTFEQSVDTTMVVTVDKCIHYWIIDSHEIGICKYCGRKRNFRSLRTNDTKTETKKRQVGKKRK
jgi:predicted O-methyltransferase YrrM